MTCDDCTPLVRANEQQQEIIRLLEKNNGQQQRELDALEQANSLHMQVKNELYDILREIRLNIRTMPDTAAKKRCIDLIGHVLKHDRV